jgi:ELWxxDGT repeat protein
LVADILPGSRGSSPGTFSGFTVFNNALYFAADDEVNSFFGLWKYDGTSASLVEDSLELVSDFTVFDDALYFSASGNSINFELWKYDGTAASLVADINPGSGGSYPGGLTVFNDAFYFGANDPVNGYELWQYDGTAASLVADINPGSGDSFPYNFTVFNNALYFGATGRETVTDLCYRGRCYVERDTELWKLEPDAPPSVPKPASVPEPASTLGLLVFAAFGATSVLKRKLQKATQLGIVDSETTD